MKDDNREKQTKGFLRNTAVNVAKDIVQAGNPFNPGGHLVGSIIDGALMEAYDRRATKKMYDNINNSKTALEMLDDMYFEKTAGLGTVFSTIGKNVGKLGNSAIKYGDKLAVKNPMIGKKVGSLGKGVSRYGELLAGGNAAGLENSMNAAKKTFSDSAKRLNSFDKKVKAGAFSGKSQDAVQSMRSNMYNNMMNKKDSYQAAKNALELEPSKVLAARVGTGVGVGALGMSAIDNVTTRMANNNKTASEMLNDLYFEKTAGISSAFSTIDKGAKRYKSLLTGSKIGDLAEEVNDAKQIYNTTKKINDKNTLDLLNKQLNSEKNKVLATRIGTGVATGIGLGVDLNYLKNRNNKTASEILDDAYFEKTAETPFYLTMDDVQGMQRYLNLLSGGRLKILKNMADVGKETGFKSKAVENAINRELKTERAKVLATRAGTGIVGSVGLGVSAINKMKDKKKQNQANIKSYASVLDDAYFEKTAGIGSTAKKIANKITSSKPVQAAMSNPKISRGVELMTGSKAKALAKEIQDIENQKDNLTMLQRLTLKKRRLNRVQNKKYKEFDIEAGQVDKARKGVLGVGAVGLTGANLLKNHIKDKRYLKSMPEEDVTF